MDAITLRNVSKHFRKQAERKRMTTIKSELIGLLRRKKQPALPAAVIPALRDITLSIPQGKTVGIVGRNGSGKSTLLKLITGIYRPSSGFIQVNGRISALLELGAGFHPDFSGRENILINGIILGMSRNEIKDRMQEIIEFSELGEFIDQPIRTYSSGMYMRLAFAVATHVDPDILIVDEILAVGDEHFSRKSMAKMNEFKRTGKTIVLVTHALGTVQEWCDLAAWIDGGTVRMVGEPGRVVEEYRQSVLLAEAQGNPLLAPALAPDGGALPTRAAPPRPTAGPEVPPDRRWGTFQVELERVRLLDSSGADVTTVDTEAVFDVCMDYRCKEPLMGVSFSVAVFRGDGTLVFATNTVVDRVETPQPLRDRGTVRFRFNPVCFREGGYSLDVSAVGPENTVLDFHKGLYSFTVRSDIQDMGVARPPHQWRLEAAEPTASRLSANAS